MSGRSGPAPFYVNSALLSAQVLSTGYYSAVFPDKPITVGETNQMALYLSTAGTAPTSVEFIVLFSKDGTSWVPEETETTSGSSVTHTIAVHTTALSAITMDAGATLSSAGIHVPTGCFEFAKLIAKRTGGDTTTALSVYYELGDCR